MLKFLKLFLALFTTISLIVFFGYIIVIIGRFLMQFNDIFLIAYLVFIASLIASFLLWLVDYE